MTLERERGEGDRCRDSEYVNACGREGERRGAGTEGGTLTPVGKDNEIEGSGGMEEWES
jgi:hypothetical protein